MAVNAPGYMDSAIPQSNFRLRFDSAYRYAEELKARLGDRPNAYPEPFNLIR